MPAAGYELRPIRVEGLEPHEPAARRRARCGAGRAAVGAARARSCATLRPDAVLGGGGYVAGPGRARRGRCARPARADRGRQPPRPDQPAAGAVRAARLPRVPDRRAATARATASPGARSRRRRPTAPPRARASASRDERARACSSSAARSARARSTRRRSRRSRGAPFRVLHAAGERDYRGAARRAPRGRATTCARTSTRLRPRRWRRPTSCVARAGGSIFEIAAHGRPAILVPYPHADRPTTRPRTPAGWPTRAPRWSSPTRS